MIQEQDIPVRGCGTREPGGVYLESHLVDPSDPNSKPIEHFLIDPPLPVDDWGLPSRGVTIREMGEHHHIIDWVGAKNYPNVCDFVEEVRRFGLSRRLSPNLKYELLSLSSRIYLVHPRAFVANIEEYRWTCPKGLPEHRPEGLLGVKDADTRCCAGVWWEDVVGGEPCQEQEEVTKFSPTRRTTSMRRTMPSFSYLANPKPEGVISRYRAAIFMGLAAHRIVVVRSSDGSHNETLDAIASKTSIPVDEVPE